MAKAGDDYIKGALIENTFTSIDEMSTVVFPFLKWIGPIKSLMLKLKWESINEIQHVSTPLFFIGGELDVLVPAHMTDRLESAATKSKYKEKWIVPQGQHNTTFMVAGPQYFYRIMNFFRKCRGLDPAAQSSINMEPLNFMN